MPKMVFSDLYKSPKSPFAKFRQLHSSSQQQSAHLAEDQQPSELLDYGDPDLLSRDKAKQKEAVRRYLAEKILNDWDFAWPSADVSSAYTGAAKARARAIQKRLVRSEQVGLLDPSETFASPLSPVDGNAPLSLAAVSAAVAADAAAEAGAGDEPNFDEFDSDAESVYSTVSEDAIHFRPRAEWTSDLSEDEKPGAYYQRMPTYVHSPFRFDSPDAVGTAVNIPADERKAKARRDLRAEIVWNEGLACFTARRDAWTGARTVHLKPAKPIAPTSPVSPRRGLFRFHSHTKSEPAPVAAVHTNAVAVAAGGKTNGQDSHSASTTPTAPAQSNSPPGRASSTMPLSPVTSNSRHSQHSQHSHQSQQSAGQETVATTPMTSDCGGGGGVDGAMLQQLASRTSVASAQLGLTRSRASRASRTHPDYSVETIIPVAPPLLPPGNPMRASITPAIYLSLYDKLVSSSLQPSCPINLSDMIRSCVSGWKRDDEWPPRPTEMSAPAVAAMSVALRKKRRDEQREIQKDKRDTANHVGDAGSGGLPSPGLTRRMSNFLGGKPSSGNIILPATTATLAGAGPASPPIDEKDDAGINGQRGIRRSLQRVLGLGYVAHGGGGNTNASIGGHGHSLSVGSVGQSTKQI
ncbi:hypothetical protein HMPREF1624_08673 [Sporothrix schenckii ATCC 58251]|uniref:Gag1-like clamp domain-containing protein n=1 Tax=Sporothrix schenckii (strain ATCC 58251 / de Perez 2211183) TaxID=1391915 RepID=U7PJ78_SPOS1|nr:hypothetical protein HMPREF1624_08673 [Sporothrix schenckii ATCC 58251]